MQGIYRIKTMRDKSSINTKNGTMSKRTVILQELGGEWADSFQVSLFGADADKNYSPGTVVAASLRFRVTEYDGNTYQDITASAFVFIGKE